MFSARFCAEKVLTFGLSSFVWLLQKLFGRVFDPEPDIELLAVQLGSGAAVLHDLHLHQDFVNQWLIPYGLEASSGSISKLELKFREISSLSLSVEMEVLDLKLKRRMLGPSFVECASPEESTGNEAIGRFQSWIKSILKQLVVKVNQIRVDFEGIGVCEISNLEFSQDLLPSCGIEKLYFGLYMKNRSLNSERILALTNCCLNVDFSNDDYLMVDASIGLLNTELTPEVVRRIQRIIRKQGMDSEDEFGSVKGTEFFSLDGSELAESMFAASMDESVFYDCEEDQSEDSISKSAVVGWLSKEFKTRLKISEIEAVLSSDLGLNPDVTYLLSIQDLELEGFSQLIQELEISCRKISLMDRVCKMEAEMKEIRTEVPETLKSMLSKDSENEEWNCGFKFGFPQLQEESCLKLKVSCKSEFLKKHISVEINSLPILFSWNAISLLNMKSLVDEFKLQGSGEASAVGQEIGFNAEWRTGGFYGILEQSEDFLFFEVKTGPPNLLLSSKLTPDRRTFRLFESSEAQTTTIKVAELNLYHCYLNNAHLTNCRRILSCSSSLPTQDRTKSSTEEGCVLELTSYAPPRRVHHDLSTLAYDLFDEYTKEAPDVGSNAQQDRNLARVGFEGRCMQSMESFIDLWTQQLILDLNFNDLEILFDVLLQFWNPAQMSEQLKNSFPIQRNCLIRFQTLTANLHSLSLRVAELEAFLVTGLQNQPISTLAITVDGVDVLDEEFESQVRVGAPAELNELTGPRLQFFQISELDYRNAKFKQWSVLQTQEVTACFHEKLIQQEWFLQSFKHLLRKHRTRLESDVEIENFCSIFTQNLTILYRVQDSGVEVCLAGRVDRSRWTLQDLKKLESEIHRVELLVRQNSSPFRTLDPVFEETGFSTLLVEDQLKVSLKPTTESEFDCEIRNLDGRIELNADRISGLLQILHSLNSRSLVLRNHTQAPVETPPMSSTASSAMQEIIDDAFSVPCELNSAHGSSSQNQLEDEEVNGFVLVDYPITGSPSTSNSPAGRELRCSDASWIDGASLTVKDDYILVPDHHQLLNEDHPGSEMEESCLKLPCSYPKSSFIIRLDGLRGDIVIEGEDPMDHVDFSFHGLTVFYYSFFKTEGNYRDRLVAVVQDFEAMDWRTSAESCSGTNPKKPIIERNKSKLKTKFSQELKQIQRVTNPMIQFVLETVSPDQSITTTEKRLKLTIVPLRLRLSQLLLDFAKCFIDAIPHSNEGSFGNSYSLYFQKCEILPVYVVVDWKPSPFNLDRLKSGHTSEILNIIQWGGLEFILQGVKLSGVAGSEDLMLKILTSWSQDIKSSHRHRLVSGIPTLGILKRMSPAAQNIIESSISTLYRKEAAEVNQRGLAISPTPPLSRSATVFGKAILLEALNAGANASEGIQSVLDGNEGGNRAPVDPASALRSARTTLKEAAKALFEEPMESVRSGQGLKAALVKASQAAPKALLSPFSALNGLIHGTLRGACDALDTDHVLDS